MNKTYTMAVVGLTVALLLSACSKTTNTTLRIHLTSNPGSYEAVNVEIKAVWVKVAKENTGWFFLKTSDQMLNLNRIANGKDTIIATGEIPQSDIKEVRMIFGPKNSIVSAGKPYNLQLSSDLDGGGVNIRFQQTCNTDVSRVTFDLDATASVKESGTNQFTFNPVIRAK